MGRSPCCEKAGLKKGPWTPEEDHKLMAFIEHHGHGSWRALPLKAGLERCGKSCRLRWINYLRPDIKRGKFSLQEEQTIIQLHALLGNRWSAIATHLPKRTDNEIKNYWNTHLKKRLTKMGIDPVTHKPKSDALGSAAGNPRDAANLSHMAQWESARLEAEARLVRESKLMIINPTGQTTAARGHKTAMLPAGVRPQCLDVLKAWQGVVAGLFTFNTDTLESPTSTLNFVDHTQPASAVPQLSFIPNSLLGEVGVAKDDGGGDRHKIDNVTETAAAEMPPFDSVDGSGGWFQEAEHFMEGYDHDPDDRDHHVIVNCHKYSCSNHHDDQEPPQNPPAFENGLIGDEGKINYWNSILNNLVNTSPSNSPVF